jgi:hypothetical protein
MHFRKILPEQLNAQAKKTNAICIYLTMAKIRKPSFSGIPMIIIFFWKIDRGYLFCRRKPGPPGQSKIPPSGVRENWLYLEHMPWNVGILDLTEWDLFL